MRSRSHGVTLIELTIMIVILSITIPSTFWFFAENSRKAIESERRVIATLLVEERMEEVLSDRHSSTRGYSYLVTGNYPDDTPLTGYTRVVEFEDVDPSDLSTTSPGSGFRKITVTVSYSSPDGSSAFSTVVSDS